MRVARWWKAGAVLVFMALAPLAQAQRVAMVGGTLVDGTLSDPIRDSVILIEGQRIVAVGTVKTLPVPADATVISTEGMTVLPGLWDMHVHFTETERTFPLFVANGVLGVRNAGGDADVLWAPGHNR